MRRRGFGKGHDPKRYSVPFSDYNRRVESPAAKLGLSPADYEAKRAAGLKWCSRCREWHPIADFGPNRHSRDGRDGFCQSCRRTYRREYRRKAVAA